MYRTQHMQKWSYGVVDEHGLVALRRLCVEADHQAVNQDGEQLLGVSWVEGSVYAGRFFFDISFFIIIVLILLNMVFGIILGKTKEKQ